MNKLRPKTIDLRGVNLSPEEGYILSRIDAPVSVRELVALTGLEEPRLLQIVSRLAGCGAIDMDANALPGGASAPPSSPSSASSLSAPSAPESRPKAPSITSEARPRAPSIVEAQPVDDPSELESLPELEEVIDDDPLPSETNLTAHTKTNDDDGGDDEEEEELPPEETKEEPPSDAEEAERVTIDQERHNEREYRKIYETIYRGMDRDLRMQAAKTATGSHLMALCLDMEPQIIHAVLSNPHMGLDQARFIALYHRTHIGLEILARRNEFVSDVSVQRRLLRNPQLPDPILKKIVHPKMLSDVYKIAVDREIPERSRVKTAELLRRKFMLAGSDERVALIVKTEGRVLILLTNCALDAHATQILCGKTTWGMLLIRNLAHWPATPPAVLRHLLKQAVVRQNVGLRKMILKHPNTPSDVKRAFLV